MNKRQHEHDNGKCRTTNKYNKSGKLKEIRYADIFDESYEKTFKKYSTKKKLKLSSSWKIWDGRGEVTI